MNKVELLGRLTKDPEIRYTQNNTPVASFSLAVNRRFAKEEEQQADFINCVAWSKRGEFVNKYFIINHKKNSLFLRYGDDKIVIKCDKLDKFNWVTGLGLAIS